MCASWGPIALGFFFVFFWGGEEMRDGEVTKQQSGEVCRFRRSSYDRSLTYAFPLWSAWQDPQADRFSLDIQQDAGAV